MPLIWPPAQPWILTLACWRVHCSVIWCRFYPESGIVWSCLLHCIAWQHWLMDSICPWAVPGAKKLLGIQKSPIFQWTKCCAISLNKFVHKATVLMSIYSVCLKGAVGVFDPCVTRPSPLVAFYFFSHSLFPPLRAHCQGPVLYHATPHHTTHHYTSLHFTTLHTTTLHYTTHHYTSPH